MGRFPALLILVVLISLVEVTSVAAASSPKNGSACRSTGKIVVVNKTTYRCEVIHSKKVWRRVVPVPIVTANPVTKPTPIKRVCLGRSEESWGGLPVGKVESLAAEWRSKSLFLSFNFDRSDPNCPGNSYVQEFRVKIVSEGGEVFQTPMGMLVMNKGSNAQSFELTPERLRQTVTSTLLRYQSLCVIAVPGGTLEVCITPPMYGS